MHVDTSVDSTSYLIVLPLTSAFLDPMPFQTKRFIIIEPKHFTLNMNFVANDKKNLLNLIFSGKSFK